MLVSKAEAMAASLRFIMRDKRLLAALQAGDRKTLLALSAPIYERLHRQHNVTHSYFHDAQRINLLRTHQPERFGDLINRHTALGAQKSATVFSGIELGPGTFTLRSVLPVVDNGRPEQGLAMAQRHQQQLAVMFMDLDHFKEVNDTHGHDMGDLLLRETAKRLLGCVRKSDMIARMGGDEFTVILTESSTPESAEYVAKKHSFRTVAAVLTERDALQRRLQLGIALYPKHGRDGETLLRNADTAMYQAKITRNTYCFYHESL